MVRIARSRTLIFLSFCGGDFLAFLVTRNILAFLNSLPFFRDSTKRKNPNVNVRGFSFLPPKKKPQGKEDQGNRPILDSESPIQCHKAREGAGRAQIPVGLLVLGQYQTPPLSDATFRYLCEARRPLHTTRVIGNA